MMTTLAFLGILILSAPFPTDLPPGKGKPMEETSNIVPPPLWPASPSQESYSRETPYPRQAGSPSKGSPLIDFSRMEIEAKAGVLFFSEDFDATPSISGSLYARVPLPFLTPRSKGNADYFGLYAEVLFSTVDRDIEPPVGPEDSGPVLVAELGADFRLIRDTRWRLSAHAGLQYWYFGDVSELEDGLALGAGVDGGLNLGKKFWITLRPSMGFGHAGDWIAFLEFGLQYRF